jgi:prevent-host-death family protein
MFAMGDLKDRLTEIERHALRGGPVILTRHGRPVFALVRIDKAEEGLGKREDESRPLTKLEQDLYDEAFARGERDIASGNLTDWATIERRVEAALARRRKARRPVGRTTKRGSRP